MPGSTPIQDTTPVTDNALTVVPKVDDAEKQATAIKPEVDIEHTEVEDDPRQWPRRKKYATFFFVCWLSMAAAMSANIYFPAIDDLRRDLKASQQVINLSVSLFVFFQGVTPILWSAICELYGRKIVYITAFTIFTVSQIVCATAKNQILFLMFRIIGATGSSAALTLGGGTLADIYEQAERGEKLGFYYIFPLLGPSVGTLLGGALTLSPAGWRAAFWCMAAYGGSCLLWACLWHDTFRKERSVAWTAAYRRAQEAVKAKNEQHRQAAGLPKKKPWSRSGTRSPTMTSQDEQLPLEEIRPEPARRMTGGRALTKVTTETGEEIPIKIHFSDISPIGATGTILRQPSNLLAVLSSGLLFGGQYSLTYTGALSFAAAPYNYDSLKVGLVLLCFGAGNIVGSICGGKYSDIVRNRLVAKTGSKGIPEWRIRAAIVIMPLIPASFAAYAWAVEEKIPIYGPCIILFLAGLCSIWVYSITLAYIVDSSVGMASSAISCNSAFRGIFGFLASEIAQPLLDSIGNGWLYTMWAVIMAVALLCLLLVCWKGHEWKVNAAIRKEEKERQRADQEMAQLQ